MKKIDEHYRRAFLFLSKGCVKIAAFILLVCFALSSVVEAKGVSSVRRHAPRHSVAAKQKVARAPVIRKKSEIVVPRKQSQRASVISKQLHTRAIKARQSRAFAAKTRSSRATPVNRRPSQIAAAKANQMQAFAARRNLQTRVTPPNKPQPKTTAAQKAKQRQSIAARKSVMRRGPIRSRTVPPKAAMQKRLQNSLHAKSSSPVKVSLPPRQSANIRLPLSKHPVQQKANHAQLPIVPVKQPIHYLSLLKPHTQRNAELGGFGSLYSKDHLGQAQTVAPIEYSGVWQQAKDIIHNDRGMIHSDIKDRYKRNFLTPIGGGKLHPEKKNDWVRLASDNDHGSSVASVVMDLSPQTKILPVSTYNSPETPTQPRHFYDISDALMDLSLRKDVGVINISGGWVNLGGSADECVKIDTDTNGKPIVLFKTKYTPKMLEGFKAVARAGKVVVMAAGNQERDIQPLKFEQGSRRGGDELIAHLLEALDPETRKSLVIAGNLNPHTRKLCSTSNKPGVWPEAQERFLCASGYHMLSHVDFVVEGTSFAAPYVCAAIANLCSKPGVTPRQAAQALLDTADRHPDVRTYGRGLIRADKALELLERRR